MRKNPASRSLLETDVYFWTTVDPLYVFSFLQTFIDILNEYFGQISAETLKDNFDIVYQVSLRLVRQNRIADLHMACRSCWKRLWTLAGIRPPPTPMRYVIS